MQFGTAKAVLAFSALFGWCVAALGGVAFLYLFSQSGFLQALSALSIIVLGVFTVATSQMGLAQIATAENTASLLNEFRANNAMQSSSQVSNNSSQSSSSQGFSPKRVGDRVKAYKGREILKEETGVSVDGRAFSTVMAAERWISEQK